MERLEEDWLRRVASLPIDAQPTFRGDGLVIGAGSVLARRATVDDAESIQAEGSEERLVVVLSAAYCKAFGPDLVKHFRAALRHWRCGDGSMAAMHLALGGLGRLADPRRAARRLYMADRLLEAGALPETILAALDVSVGPLRLAKAAFDPDEPRVPAGSGRPSGQWTSGDDAAPPTSGSPPTAAASSSGGENSTESTSTAPSAQDAGVDAFDQAPDPAAVQAAKELVDRTIAALEPAAQTLLLGLTEAQLATVVRIVGVLAAPTAFLTTLLIPSNAGPTDEGPIPGHARFSYVHLPGEVGWRITFLNDRGEGIEVPAGPDGIYRDQQGQPLARLLPNGTLALNISPETETATQREDPKVCPQPSPDREGQGVGSRGRIYEDQMKALLNPDSPTPSGYGRELPAPTTRSGKVIYDDCWLKNGAMFEYKGPGYAGLIHGSSASPEEWYDAGQEMDQSLRQVQAANGRQVIWMFAEPEAARYFYRRFQTEDQGREKIIVGVFPYLGA